ncbi:hypothetical protein K2173_026167 [Erythroxylum novogranatense]|uniref:C2HC zinc finger plants domain-containing protein n=1 Tax=Erythroxylum novogranatense TaxID=1862640 RepID=A0AAV8T8Y2_9ROSI|nr:hypothetical protein K2173_026167 [Erythroxylum novogranatense]
MTDSVDTEMEAVVANPNDAVRELLTNARLLINEGRPSEALRAVVMAVRRQGGDAAVRQSLNRAQELYKNRLRDSIAIDQLASLFAECAIADAQSLNPEQPTLNVRGSAVHVDVNGNSILAETGRMQIVLDAFSDGSSFICLQCGGLVSNHRKDEHYAYWCSKI